MTTATLPAPANIPTDVFDQLAASFRRIEGSEVFEGAVDAFLKGDVNVDDAVQLMESFFQGSMNDDVVERERVVELAKSIETMCGGVSIYYTVIACTLAFSCIC